MRKFQAEVLRLHEARRNEQARGAGDEDGLGVIVAEGFELAQPPGEDGSDAVERQLGVNAQNALRLARGKVQVGVVAQAALEVGKFFSGKGEADGKGVAAEASEEIGAGFDGGEEGEAVDRAARAVRDAIFHADDEGGLGGALDNARGENADDAAMPPIAVDHEEPVGCNFGVGAETGFDDGERSGLDVAAFAIEALQLCGQLDGTVGVARRKKLDDVGRDVHAAGGVDARGEAKGDIEAGDLLACRVERSSGEERAETGADGTAELTQAECGDGAIFAVEGHGVSDGGDGRHLEKAGQNFFAQASGIAAKRFGLVETGLLKQRLGELERDGSAAEAFFGIGAARLIRVEDGEGNGKRVVGVGQVVVGDDEVEAEAARGIGFSKRAHARVDGDDDANAFGLGRFKHARLHAIAVAEAMRNVKADVASQHFDGGFEKDDSDRAVDVVVAIEEDGLVRGDGAFETVDGGGHAPHQEWIVEVRGLGVEEGEGLGGGGDATRNEQLGEDEGQARITGERCGSIGVRVGQEPALRRQGAR